MGSRSRCLLRRYPQKKNPRAHPSYTANNSINPTNQLDSTPKAIRFAAMSLGAVVLALLLTCHDRFPLASISSFSSCAPCKCTRDTHVLESCPYHSEIKDPFLWLDGKGIKGITEDAFNKNSNTLVLHLDDNQVGGVCHRRQTNGRSSSSRSPHHSFALCRVTVDRGPPTDPAEQDGAFANCLPLRQPSSDSSGGLVRRQLSGQHLVLVVPE